MTRLVVVSVRTLFVLLVLAGLASAQEPPPLEPPSLEPPSAASTPEASPGPRPGTAVPRASDPRPSPRPARPRPENRPMLAIPGVTAPASRPPAASAVPPGNPGLSPPLAPLPLDLPTSRPEPGPSGFPLAGPPLPEPLDDEPFRLARPTTGPPPNASRPHPSAGETIPLTIEPLDDELANPRGSSGRPPSARPADGRPATGPGRPARDEDEPIATRRTIRRAPGLLGRIFSPLSAPLPPPRESSRTAQKPTTSRAADPDSPPDLDTAARRKIERQIAATLGDRVRSVEVSVTGRNVEIHAQPSRFWLRRSVRRSLETLPAIQGYRARIDVAD